MRSSTRPRAVRLALASLAPLLLASGCAGGGGAGAEAELARTPAVPCQTPVPGRDTGEWRQVSTERFTFCVPPGWDRVGSQEWRDGRTAVEWGTGRAPREFQARIGAIPEEDIRRSTERFSETIGGRDVELFLTTVSETVSTSFRTGAQWEPPDVIYFRGEATNHGAARLQLDVYRTVRFTGG